MTAPGGIQPLNSVPTAPMYFSQSPGLAAQLAPTTRLLLEAIKQHQDQVAAQGQANTDAGVGNTLSALLPALAQQTNPGGTVPAAQGTGMIAPVTVAPTNTVSQRMAKVFAGKPGEVVLGASKVANNAILESMNAEQKALSAPKPTGKTVDVNGNVFTTFADGSTKQQFKPDGTPITVPTTVRGTAGDWKRVGVNADGKIHWRNFATGQDYFEAAQLAGSTLPGAQKPSAATAAAAGYLIPALNAYDRLRTLGPLNIDPINYMGAFKLASTGHVADVTKWLSQNAVSPHDRAIIETMIPFVQAVAHSQGGKRITDAQLQQYIQSLTPFANDKDIVFPDGTTQLDQKDRVQRSHLLALYYQAQPSLAGRGVPDLEAQWPDLAHFNLGNGLPSHAKAPASSLPGLSPDNPLNQAPAPAPTSVPPMLRRPQ